MTFKVMRMRDTVRLPPHKEPAERSAAHLHAALAAQIRIKYAGHVIVRFVCEIAHLVC